MNKKEAAKNKDNGSVEKPRDVYVIPNFHPASCGWLTDWSTERNYCANSYLDHLDRVRDDASYNFAISEVNNMIAMFNFTPERFAELKVRIGEGRAEPCNAFFLEPTINLSGGEALVKCGVEGLRWQQQVFGFRPRLAWMTDVIGVHEQMAQITDGLGLDGIAYCRYNDTGYGLHYLESPDGTRSFGVAPGLYSDRDMRPLFTALEPISKEEMLKFVADLDFRASSVLMTQEEQKTWAPQIAAGLGPQRTPAGAPVLSFAGITDYSIAPLCKEYPAKFIQQFEQVAPQYNFKISTPTPYLDAVRAGLKTGKIQLVVKQGGTEFGYKAMLVENPRVKTWFRRCEQKLQSAEMLAAVASLMSEFVYPVAPLYHGWLLMCLNMDRNTLWGAACGKVFEHPTSWDVTDRFEWVEKTAHNTSSQALRSLLGKGDDLALFNPLNWERNDPFEVPEKGLCRSTIPSVGVGALGMTDNSVEIVASERIETKHYSLRIDPATGALASLKLKSSGREMLAGPANVIVAERPKVPSDSPGPGDEMVDREYREVICTSNSSKPVITVSQGQLAVTIEIRSTFINGGVLVRTVRCYEDYPRIDFKTELNDIPDKTLVLAEFPLASTISSVRRGIPYGFSHGAWAVPNEELHGWTKGIVPAVRWSHYEFANGGGAALLDRGLSGRELTGSTPVIFLLNTCEIYHGFPSAWLSGKGRNVLHYAFVAHDGDFKTARIPHMAWEFCNPPVVVDGIRSGSPASFLQTSDNVIVEALRREGDEIEVRMVECLGLAGQAEVILNLPHESAMLTDMTGTPLCKIQGAPAYKISVRPQQIVTLRFKTIQSVEAIVPLMKWDDLVPEKKRPALNRYLPEAKGHPPRINDEAFDDEGNLAAKKISVC
jgi:alpha-mannosidase